MPRQHYTKYYCSHDIPCILYMVTPAGDWRYYEYFHDRWEPTTILSELELTALVPISKRVAKLIVRWNMVERFAEPY